MESLERHQRSISQIIGLSLLWLAVTFLLTGWVVESTAYIDLTTRDLTEKAHGHVPSPASFAKLEAEKYIQTNRAELIAALHRSFQELNVSMQFQSAKNSIAMTERRIWIAWGVFAFIPIAFLWWSVVRDLADRAVTRLQSGEGGGSRLVRQIALTALAWVIANAVFLGLALQYSKRTEATAIERINAKYGRPPTPEEQQENYDAINAATNLASLVAAREKRNAGQEAHLQTWRAKSDQAIVRQRVWRVWQWAWLPLLFIGVAFVPALRRIRPAKKSGTAI